MVDIHCHILPEVDDGAKSWDLALEMCRMASHDGIRHIVATPHANSVYAYDRARADSVLQKLRVHARDLPLEFSLGCDFHFCYDNVEAALGNKSRFTISGTGYLLIEFSDFSIPPTASQTIYNLGLAGMTCIITHPERNQILLNRPEMVLKFAEQGCVIQVTAAALTGRWGKKSQNVAQWLMERDAVHVLATDAHDVTNRPPILSKACEIAARWANQDIARVLVNENPHAIVTGQPLPFFPRPLMKP
jgi:protein-tyrosine phosphatase